MGYIKFYDAAFGGDQIIFLGNAIKIDSTTNDCSITYGLLASDDSAISLIIYSTGNGSAIRAKIIEAIGKVDGGGITTMDMSDTATTQATDLNGPA